MDFLKSTLTIDKSRRFFTFDSFTSPKLNQIKNKKKIVTFTTIQRRHILLIELVGRRQIHQLGRIIHGLVVQTRPVHIGIKRVLLDRLIRRLCLRSRRGRATRINQQAQVIARLVALERLCLRIIRYKIGRIRRGHVWLVQRIRRIIRHRYPALRFAAIASLNQQIVVQLFVLVINLL